MPVAGDDGRCMLCGLWATDAEVHCRGCLLGGGRRRHVDGPGCLRARCGGHSFLDVQHNSPLPGSHGTSMDYSPSPPHSRDGGVIDSSMDSSSSRFSPSDDIHDDDDMGPPPDDEGDGRRPTDTSLLRPRWRVDLFADTQAPPGHNYGPHFDHGMDSGLVPPRPDLAPSTPMSDRLADDLASSSGRSRSHRGSRSAPRKVQQVRKIPSQVHLDHMLHHIHQMRIRSDPGPIRQGQNYGQTARTVRTRIPRDRSNQTLIATTLLSPLRQ